MKRNLFFGTLILVTAATSAFAGTTYQGDIAVESTPFVSTRTQAEVQAELAQYKQAGINPWSTSYNPLKYFRSAKSREVVQQEYLASRDEVRGMTAEDSGSAYLAQHRVLGGGSQLAGHLANPQ
jgi:hypothetical protein